MATKRKKYDPVVILDYDVKTAGIIKQFPILWTTHRKGTHSYERGHICIQVMGKLAYITREIDIEGPIQSLISQLQEFQAELEEGGIIEMEYYNDYGEERAKITLNGWRVSSTEEQAEINLLRRLCQERDDKIVAQRKANEIAQARKVLRENGEI